MVDNLYKLCFYKKQMKRFQKNSRRIENEVFILYMQIMN